MILYLYALADGLTSVEDGVGAAQEPLRFISVESITVVAGELDAALPVDRVSLAAQDRVVRRLHDQAAALLPMRFGTVYATESEAAHAIRTQAVGLRERLERARHREQMTVRITAAPHSGPTPPAAPVEPVVPASGEQYLRARAAAAVPAEIAPLLETLEPLQRATRVERGKTAGVVATVYQLIDRGSSEAYRAAVSRAAAALPALSVHVTGPSPCYAFA